MSTGFERIGKDSQLQDHWLRRLIAFIIDSIIAGIAALILAVIISIPFAIFGGWAGIVFNPFSFPFFTGILSILYFSLFETYYGATFGKRIMNLKPTKFDGQGLSLDLALIRNASKIYWIVVLLDTVIGLATPGDMHQKVTDRIAGTTVVSTGAPLLPLATTEAKPSASVCSNCGEKLPENAKYCSHCGKESD